MPLDKDGKWVEPALKASEVSELEIPDERGEPEEEIELSDDEIEELEQHDDCPYSEEELERWDGVCNPMGPPCRTCRQYECDHNENGHDPMKCDFEEE